MATRRFFFAVCSVLGWMSGVRALPDGPTIVHGDATFSTIDSMLEVTSAPGTILHWDQFSIGKEEIARFVQSGKDSTLLNRVIGSLKSEILGELSSNGRVYLINPNGVIFGPDACVKTAEFVASTHEILDEHFIEQRDLFFEGNSQEEIVNLGTITSEYGDVVLIAHRVRNHGTINAQGGEAIIGCGYEVLLKPRTDQPLAIRVGLLQEQEIPALIENSGVVRASPSLDVYQSDGRIYLGAPDGCCMNTGTLIAQEKIEIDAHRVLQAGSLVSPSIAVAAEGYIDTEGAKLKGAQIDICADRQLFSSGDYDATGDRGGTVHLLGKKISLCGTRINASGLYQGGEVLIGGSEQDAPSLLSKAEDLYINGSVLLQANALQEGVGGKIVLQSDGQTIFKGEAVARGITEGGFVEVSGKREFLFQGMTHVDASQGKAGTLLLDPQNIVIDSTTGMYPEFELIDPNQGGGTGFGNDILPLSTGNIVVTKPEDDFVATNSGAVYLYNGATGALISTITGSSSSDLIGIAHPIALQGNGNYLICSPGWQGAQGALTWANGNTGISGVVSTANSLVGATASDQVGARVTALGNGNYLAATPHWDNGSTADVGAVTWGNGTTGTVGVVGPSNSLIGSASGDQVGGGTISTLKNNNNAVVTSPNWSNGGTTPNAGAVTWIDGSAGIVGVVSSNNSLIGSTSGDEVGALPVTGLTNGNYVVGTATWNSSGIPVGAATWGNGTTGVTGTISATNSLVGSTGNDAIGNATFALSNGNYVTGSSTWTNGSSSQAGAVAWGNGTTGTTGVVSPSNSLVGSTPGDFVSFGVLTLTNGNYVVLTPQWTNGSNPGAGAATWGSGTTGVTGTIDAIKSLTGANANDQVGNTQSFALSNGNYVVLSPAWNSALGAATWGNGTTGVAGLVTNTNSLVGTTVGDQVGFGGAALLSNGHYVVISPSWSNGGVTNAGAATWGNGTTGITGAVTSTNSLVGTATSDQVGAGRITALSNGNYVVSSSSWNLGATAQVGAVTWGSGTTGVTGVVSSANSLTGSTAGDRVGGHIFSLTPGDYVVLTTSWQNNGIANAGAATFGSGVTGVTGVVSSSNSLVGTATNNRIGTAAFQLSNGGYVVANPFWANGSLSLAGAATPGNSTAPATGVVSAGNSVVGLIANAALSAVAIDSVNNTFISYFANEGTSGKLRVGLDNYSTIAYTTGVSQTMTIHPDALVSLLNRGTSVVLQASNNITVNSPITLTGSPGSLTLDAGGSVNLNASITTSGGGLTIVATNGSVTASNPIDTSATGSANGGAVSITSTQGSISVKGITTSGGTSGGHGGAITLQPASGVTSGLPAGTLTLGGDLIANGGAGKGNISLSATGRSGIVEVATIFSSTSGNNLSILGNSLTVGPFEAITILGNIQFSLDTQATVGDMVALDALTITAPTINLLLHGTGQILAYTGSLYNTTELHLIANASAPTLTGTQVDVGTGPTPLIGQYTLATRSVFESMLLYNGMILNFDGQLAPPTPTPTPVVVVPDINGSIGRGLRAVVATSFDSLSTSNSGNPAVGGSSSSEETSEEKKEKS